MEKPENSQTQTSSLREIIARIAVLIDVERIYIHKPEKADGCQSVLTILIANTCTRSPAELLPLISMVFAEQQTLRFALHPAHQIKEAITKGNLYFFSICTDDNLLYHKEGSAYELIPASLNSKQMLENARKQYDSEEEKIKAFVRGTDFYLEKENYAQSAFMLHQAIELSYRAIEHFITGRSKITHRISSHQKYLEPYDMALSRIFSTDCERDTQLLKLLDDAYLAVRYENSYQISVLDLRALQLKSSEVKRAADAACERVQENFRSSPVVDPVSETMDKVIAGHLDFPLSLIEQICGALDVVCIYCFGKRTYQDSRYHPLDDNQHTHVIREHFDLLVITADQPERKEAALQSKINSKSSNPCTVLLLAVSLETLTDLLNANNRFFHHVVARAYVLHQTNERVFSRPMAAYDESRTLLDCKMHWNQRHSRADALIAATEPAWEAGEETVVVSLIAQGVEQICLGLIFVFLGYQPDRYTISHLFDLCSNFTPLLDDLFPRKNQLDQDVFKVLAAGGRNVRYLAKFSPDPTETGVLHQRLELLIKQSGELVQRRFDQIKV